MGILKREISVVCKKVDVNFEKLLRELNVVSISQGWWNILSVYQLVKFLHTEIRHTYF